MKVISLAILTFAAVASMGGFAFADIKWDLDGGVTTGYDSNITYVDHGPIGDMVTHTSLNGGLTQQGQNDLFNFKTGITENIYTGHSSFDNLSEELNTSYTGDITPYEHVKAQDTFSHSVDPYTLENAFGRINGDYDTYFNNLDLESATDITEQWKAGVKYKETDYTFSNQGLSSSTGYDPEVSMEYDFSSQSQGMVYYDYRRRAFSPGESSDANTPSAGWRQYLTPQWYVDLLAGADFIKGFGENLTEPRYAAGLTHDLDQNTQLTLKYDKQYEADPFTQDIFNDWHVSLNGVHQFTSRINGDIALFSGEGRYIISGISEKFIGTSMTAKYTLNEHAEITLTYSLQDSNSNSDIRAYLRDTVFAGITYKF